MKRTVAVPTAQDADVLAFVQEPETVHVSEPKAMKDTADETATLPEMLTFPEVLVRAPPERVSAARTIVKVVFARTPPDTARAAFTVRLEARVAVPAATVRLLNACVMVVVAAAVNTTVLVPAVKVALAAVTVQAPPTLIVDPSATRVPFVPSVTEPAVIPRLPAEVSRAVFPVGTAVEFWIVRRPARVSGFVDIV